MPDRMYISRELAEEVLHVLDMAQAGTLRDEEDFQEAAAAYESFWAVIIETFPTEEDA